MTDAPLHVFTDDVDTYIAESIDDAMALQRERCLVRQSDQDPEVWVQMDDGETLTIIRDVYAEAHETETKTCAEWIAAKGRGFLCSTEW